jgi:nucleotide-binding universal stress UspA family protein
MYKRILVAVDGSETSTKALVTALQLAREADARIHVVHALADVAYLSGYEYGGMNVVDIAREYGHKVLNDAAEIARSAGVAADTCLLEMPTQRLGEAIAGEARAWRADLVVVGTHGRRGLGRVMLGSGCEEVIRTAPAAVLAVRGT